MAKCKDCLHYEACSNFSKIINSAVDVETGCEHFKNRTDVAELVRCKDCKHNEDCIRRIQFWGRNPVLELNTTEYHPIDFCSYGERKDNG